MEKKNKSLTIIVIVSVIIIISTNFLTGYYANKQAEVEKQEALDSAIDFFKEYSIALNNIHVGHSYLELSNVNLNQYNDYVYSGDYYYEFSENIASTGKDQATEAKEYFIKSKSKLEEIQSKSPDTFFEEEISLRLEQVELLTQYSIQLFSLLDYTSKSTYEVNYGSEVKSEEYMDKYNDLIEDFNDNSKALSDLNQKIDLKWDQDWYVTFQDTYE